MKCKTPLPLAPISATSEMTQGGPSPVPAERARATPAPTPTLEPGGVLGGRYEILQLLGEGGMGAVYKARDRELDRFVALKIIHPDLANRPGVLQRFKQELILARKVTHKNVIRIFDLGEADGIKFISMDYIEGQDLKSMLKQKGKFTPEEAVLIVVQVCRALQAAHAEGVIHRDLRPQNIMLDKQGTVIVMDFGIARSMETPGMTTTGMLVGTPEHMSPEQAKGEKVDARSGLFTLGIIFYELLTGDTPFQADTALATMLKRTQERARPPAERLPTLPRYVNGVVVSCLEINPELRYQKAVDVLQDLGARQGTRRSTMALRLPRFRMVEEFPTKWIAPGLALIVLMVAGIMFRGKIFGPGIKPTEPAISLAIVPFRNASGDPKLDWLGTSLAEMLSTDVGQSSHLRTVSSDRLHQILHDLQISPDSTLDPNTLRRLAEFSSAETVVWGQYARFGEQIRIDATLQDLKRDRTAALKAEAPNEKAVLEAVDRLAEAIRENLALSPAIVKELQTQSFKPSSKSLPALRYYNEGVQLLRQGKNLEAQKQLQASIHSRRWPGRTMGHTPVSSSSFPSWTRRAKPMQLAVSPRTSQSASGGGRNYAKARNDFVCWSRVSRTMPFLCWIRLAGSPVGTQGLNGSRDTEPTRLSPSTSLVFIRPKTWTVVSQKCNFNLRPRRAASKTRAGEYERTEHVSGPMSLSPPCATAKGNWSGFRRLRGI